MLLTLASALTLAAAAPRDLSHDPDLRCLVGVAYVSGSPAAPRDAATQASLVSVQVYFFGKLDGRFSGIDLKRDAARAVQSPDFRRGLPADIQRCASEAGARGQALKDLGVYLSTLAPAPATQPR